MNRNSSFQVAIVGKESLENLRLSNIARKLLGEEQVFRFLEIRHLLEFLADRKREPTGVFFDLFSLSTSEATQAIGYIREQYQDVVISLYLDYEESQSRWNELPTKWQERLSHYIRLYKATEDIELTPIVNRTLYLLENEARYNLENAPFHVSNWAEKFDNPYTQKQNSKPHQDMVFISYSRQDWEHFVSPLVNRLNDKKISVWVDQHLLIGGDDWMDAIAEALDTCKLLVLVMTPESLESRYVKMEYRYFFNHNKPIIPLLFRSVERVPPELSLIQQIEFPTADANAPFAQLMQVIQAKLSG
jgi:hypothetical protein